LLKVHKIPWSRFEEFRKRLARLGFEFEERPYQIFLARYEGLTVNLYYNGKIVLTGRDEMLRREVEFVIDQLSS